MATVDELLIRLDATSESLRRELKKAEAATGMSAAKFERDAKRIDAAVGSLGAQFSGVTRLLGAFGVALGAQQLWGFTRGAIDAAGGLGELSQQIGISTDLIQVLDYAGTQLGLSTEQTRTAMQRLTRTIGEAAGGNRAAANAFSALGVSVRTAEGFVRGTDAVLADVADRIAAIPDPAGRAAAAVDLFGRAGQQLLPLLEGGRAGLAAFEENARRLGIVLDGDMISAADAAADKLAELDFVLSRQLQVAAVEAAPALLEIGRVLGETLPPLVNGLAVVLRTVAPLFDGLAVAAAAVLAVNAASWFVSTAAAAVAAARAISLADLATRRTVVGLALAAAAFALVESGAIDLGGSFSEVSSAASEIMSALGGVDTASASAAGGARALKDVYNDLIVGLEDQAWLLEREKELLAESASERAILLDIERGLLEARRAGQPLDEEQLRWLEGMTRAVARLGAEIKASDYLSTLRDEYDALDRTALQQQVLTDLRAAGIDVTGDAVDAEGRLTEALGGTAEQIAELSRAKFDRAAIIADVQRFQREVQSQAQRISGDITEGIYLGFTDGLDSVSDFFKTWLDRLALQILEQQFVLPITAQFVGFAPELFGIAGPRSAGGMTAGSVWGGELSGLFADVRDTFSSVFDELRSFLGFAGDATASAAEYAAMGMDPGLMGAGPASGGLGFGDILGGAGTGLAIGSLLGAITGGGQASTFGGAAGGLVGAALGSIVPGVGTLLGSILGSVGGGLLGGLFGGGESVGPISVAELRNPGGSLGLGQVNADNGGASAREFANGIIDLVTRSVEAVGGTLGTGRVTTDVGNLQDGGGVYVNAGGNFGQVQDVAEFFGDDAEAAAIAAARYIAQQAGVEGLARGVVQALDAAFATAADATDLEDRLAVINLAYAKQEKALGPVAAAIKAVNDTYDDAAKLAEELGIAEARLTRRRERDLARLADDFVEGLQDQILQATDPQAFALLELRRWRQEQIREAEAAGAGLVEIEELYGIRRQQILEQYAQAGADTLQRFLEELQGGDLAGLTPRQQLAYDRSQYDQALAAALTGGTTDEEQQALADAAEALLQTARAMFASGSGYFDLKDQVEAAIRGVLDNLPGFAMGTSSTPAGPYWVGEHGPELMMGEGAQIIPHPASVALMARMDDYRVPSLPRLEFGRGGGADMSGVIAAVTHAGAENVVALRDLSDRVRSLEEENARLRDSMQRVGAGVGRAMAQPNTGKRRA